MESSSHVASRPFGASWHDLDAAQRAGLLRFSEALLHTALLTEISEHLGAEHYEGLLTTASTLLATAEPSNPAYRSSWRAQIREWEQRVTRSRARHREEVARRRRDGV